MMRAFSLMVLALLLAGSAALGAEDPAAILPDRRRPQFEREPAYVAVPFAYDFPGIGRGVGVIGAAANINGSCTDIAGSVFGGDVKGEALGINSIHLLPERLILDIGTVHLSAVSMQNYSKRGMNTERHDYTLLEFGDTYFDGFRFTATFSERRFEVYMGFYGGKTQLEAVRKSNGAVLIETQDAPTARQRNTIYGLRFDLTDDYLDARKGFRYEASYWKSPPDSGPDFYTIDHNATVYVPLGRRSTWVFNYYQSDAYVVQRGETARAAVESQEGLDCSSLTGEDRQLCDQLVDTIIAENTYGSSSSLGGLSRLRSYPLGRFNGAHTRFAGTEVRWNLTDEKTPFNIVIMKDIRTSMQIAGFYEVGTVADLHEDLWDVRRSSYGLGFRMVTASGLVYRIDLAQGYEGFQPSIFFQYPWEM